ELGYRRVGAHIEEVLDNDIRTAVRRGILDNQLGDGLSLASRTIDGYAREHLSEMLLAGMGTAWWEREELIRQSARWLGFQRTGTAITEAFKSVINSAIRREVLESDGP